MMTFRPLRLLVIGMCIAACALAGMLLRYARRLTGRPPRVTHGICPLHSLRDSVLADRSRGILARSVVLYGRQTTAFELTSGKEFDVVFSNSERESTSRYWLCLCHVLLTTDIWSTSFRPFLPGRHERANDWILRLLKATGIRIVVYPYGADVAWRDRNRDRFDWVGKMQLDYPEWDLVQWGDVTRANVRVLCRHADVVIGMDGSLRRFLPRNDVYCKAIAIDTQALRPDPAFSPNAVPIIVHAPNHRHVKGTAFLYGALDQLKLAGILFELRVIEGLDRSKAIEHYRAADIVADQFVMGAFGVLALEGLALGKPVLTYLDHDHLENPLFNLPVVNSNRDNLAQVLAILLQSPLLRARLGAAGRAAVERYHSHEAIGELNGVIYAHVWRGAALALESTTHFDPARKPRPFTEDPADPTFWPVNVSDLHASMGASLDQLRRALDEPVSLGASRQTTSSD